VIGNANTGKSCLLHQFIENKCEFATHLSHFLFLFLASTVMAVNWGCELGAVFVVGHDHPQPILLGGEGAAPALVGLMRGTLRQEWDDEVVWLISMPCLFFFFFCYTCRRVYAERSKR
jgi:hypothetical protein